MPPPRRQSTAGQTLVALLGDQPGAAMAELGGLVEVPLPGRPPVTLAEGRDPKGVVPGYADAQARRSRILNTLVHCPEVPAAYALEAVLIRAGEVEVHLLLFATPTPRSENEAMAQLTLRFQTGSDQAAGRVEPRTVRRHAATRGDRLAHARERAQEDGGRARTPQPPPAPANRYSLDIDDDGDDLPPPFDPDRMFAEPGSKGERSVNLGRLVGLFVLFLATVATWRIVETNQEGVAHDRFNQRLAEREALARSAAAEPSTTSTSVRLQGSLTVTGTVDSEALEEGLLSALGDIGRCYADQEGWATLPPEGTVGFQLDLGAAGNVMDVVVLSQALDADGVVDCAVQVFRGLEGLTAGEGSSTVGLTLVFSG